MGIKLKITEKHFPYMGKLAQGNIIMKLFPDENIIESLYTQEKQIKDLVLLTNKGYFIKHKTNKIKTSKKGELGIIGINFKNNKKLKDRVIHCFINNEFVYI